MSVGGHRQALSQGGEEQCDGYVEAVGGVGA